MADATTAEEGAAPAREVLGMTQEELFAYLDELLQVEAAEAAAASGRTVEQELASPGFAAVRATSSYTAHLIAANNVFLSRHLIDLGLLGGAGEEPAASAGEDA